MGHYTTENLRIGLVLDRGHPRPRLRYDGRDAVIELEWLNERALTLPSGRVIIFVRHPGNLVLANDEYPNGVDLYRDADAAPLSGPGDRSPEETERLGLAGNPR